MRTLPLIASLALTVGAPLAAHAADDTSPVLELLQPPARLTIVDAGGRTVGQLVSSADGTYRLRVIGTTRTSAAPRAAELLAPPAAPHRDALAPWQMQAEQDALYRSIFSPVVTGP